MASSTSRRLYAVSNDEQTTPAKKTVRTYTEWTPSRIRTAERQADGGDLYMAATICEWLLGDDAVSGALSARTEALLGLEPTFEPAGDKRRSNKAVKALEAGEDYWRSYPESELEQLVTWRLLLGLAPARQKWTTPLKEHGGRVLPQVEFWHPQGLRYDFTKGAWFGRDVHGSEFPFTFGDGVWLLHALTKHRPWSRGLWRSLSRWVMLKWLAAQDWNRHGEKGSVLVATNKDSTDPQRKKLAQDLSSIGEDAAIALAAGWDLKLLEVSANTKQLYEAQIEMANKAIAMRIRGGNLTTNVEGGSKAATETQFKAGDLPKLRFDGEALTTTLHDQSLVYWAEFNYGDRALAPWPVYPTQPEEDRKAKAETADKAMDAATKADKLGYEIDDKEFASDFGIGWLKGRTKPEPAPVPSVPPTNGPPAAPTQVRRGSLLARLRSGVMAKEAQGFVDGQLYADALTESVTEAGQKLLQPTLDAILEELDAAEDYDDLRARLAKRYEDLDPTDLSDLVYRAMVIANLAGRHAVDQDA